MQIIKNINQQSDEWFSMRHLRVTGTCATAIIANGKGLDTLVIDKVSEYLDSKTSYKKERFGNKDTDRGNELEPVARSLFELEYEKEIEEVCFVIKDSYSGCSPDGMVKNENAIIEIKCLSAKSYIEYLESGRIPSVYFNQMQYNMFITDTSRCYFIVYHEFLGLKTVEVKKDKDTFEKIEIGLENYKTKIDIILNKYIKS